MVKLRLSQLLLALLACILVCGVQCHQLLYSEDSECKLQLVESVPQGLIRNSTIEHIRTYDAYSWLVGKAESSINIASLYWTLRGEDVMPGGTPLAIKGETLYKLIKEKGSSTPIKIAYNGGGLSTNMSDLIELNKLPNVDAVGLNFTRLFGNGVLHTKIIVTDRLHAYIGSSNMDWRSLTQIQELGIMMTNCPTLAADLDKLFQIYYMTGRAGKVPDHWPSSVIGHINAKSPWLAKIDGIDYSMYFGASPAALCPPNRSRDIDAIVTALRSAKKFAHVAVMDYTAENFIYSTGQSTFWPVIDNELRAAAFRGVQIRVMASHWRQSSESVRRFIKSLAALKSFKVFIEGKFFIVPSNKEQAKIPFARVNHNKYLVTESTAVICTSNWEGDYFTNTAGIALSITQVGKQSDSASSQKSIVTQVQNNFMRDWTSKYAHYDYKH